MAHSCEGGAERRRALTAEERLGEVVADPSALRLVEPGIYSASAPGANANEYDLLFGAVYDLVACSRIYNRVVWGYSIDRYHALCIEALGSSSGWMLDLGCGTLAFTARAYLAPESRRRPVVLLDQSLRLVRMARERLARVNGSVPGNMVFLLGDALRLPFRPGAFDSILCLNLLHVLEDAAAALRETKGALAASGQAWCTTLVRAGRLADRYMDRLAASRLLVPRSLDEVGALFDAAGLRHETLLDGSLAVMRARAAG